MDERSLKPLRVFTYVLKKSLLFYSKNIVDDDVDAGSVLVSSVRVSPFSTCIALPLQVSGG